MGKKNKPNNNRRQQTKLQKEKKREVKKKRQVQTTVKRPAAAYPANMTPEQSEAFFASLSPELAEGLRAMDEDAETELAEHRSGEFRMDPLPRRTGPRARRGRPKGVKNGEGSGGKRSGIRKRPLLMDVKPNEKGEFHPSLYLTSRYLSFKRHMERVNAEISHLESYGFDDLTSRATRVFMYRMFERKLTGELYPWQEQLLTRSGFNWQAPPRVRKEQEFTDLLKALKKTAPKNADGTIDLKKISDPALKKAVLEKVKEHEKDELPKSELTKLVEVGVPLKVDSIHARWMETLERYKAFEASGSEDKEEERHWRTWLNHQRERRRKGILSEERVRELEKAGIDWTTPRRRKLSKEEKVDAMIAEARQKDGSYDYSQIRSSFVILVSQLRKEHLAGKLAPKIRAKLEAADFVLDSYFTEKAMVQRWREKLALFVKLRGPNPKKHLGSRVLGKHSLLSWSNRQRTHYLEGKLPDYWVEELKAAKFPLTEKRRARRTLAEWQELLEEYKRKEGLRMPPSTGPDLRLRLWLVKQRDLWKKGELDAETVKVLESMGFTREFLNTPATRKNS